MKHFCFQVKAFEIDEWHTDIELDFVNIIYILNVISRTFLFRFSGFFLSALLFMNPSVRTLFSCSFIKTHRWTWRDWASSVERDCSVCLNKFRPVLCNPHNNSEALYRGNCRSWRNALARQICELSFLFPVVSLCDLEERGEGARNTVERWSGLGELFMKGVPFKRRAKNEAENKVKS